ncbi:MAG: hypothetical protein Q8Q01_03095 [archaeon]|nr:hypothetical protein [archaeon]
MMTKKGQGRMTETIAVLFIFFVLILFGIVFYFKYQDVAIKEDIRESLASRAMETTLTSLFLPELQCSRGAAEPEDNCIDLIKMNNAMRVFKENQDKYYFDIFSYANITVFQKYPTEEKWTVYEKVKLNATAKEPTFFVVVLRNEASKESSESSETTFGYGYISVEVYR